MQKSLAGWISRGKVELVVAGRVGVRVNAIVAGVIDTDMTCRLPRKTMDLLLAQTPLGRLGKPEEIANLAVFLASDLASFITGSCVGITGGF